MSLTLTSLTNIPGVMIKNNWRKGATLMQTWFSRPPAIKPAYSVPPVTNIITMDWALSFDRARDVYNKILRDRLWTREYARREIGLKLLERGYLTGNYSSKSFGDLSQPATALHKDHIDYFDVGYEYSYGMPELDDMTAALGRFSYWLAVAGNIAPIAPNWSYKVQIEEVALYIRDSYDFEGNQWLGRWSDDDVSVSPFSNMHDVMNEDFRDWRDENGKGGDFLIYSDVKRPKLAGADLLTAFVDGRVERGISAQE